MATRRRSAPMIGTTGNPEVQVGDNPVFPIALTFEGLVFGTKDPMTIQVALQRDHAAALLQLLAELKARGVLPDLPGEIQVHRRQ